MTKFDLNTEQQFISPAEAAKYYVQQGWEPVLLMSHKKTPIKSWKEPFQWTEIDIDNAFKSNNNIGLALGKRSSDLIDIDFDCPEAAIFGKALLSELPSFGRVTSPHSHRIARSQLKKGRIAFSIPNNASHLFDCDRMMLIEIRGNGHLSMFPPSVHPCGELVHWHDSPDKIQETDSDYLVKIGGLIAFLSVITMKYPKTSGSRDEVCMALTGTLVGASFEDKIIDQCVELVAETAGDEEYVKRGGKAITSREKIDNGEQVWGLPKLCEQLGISEIEDTLRKWLGSTSIRKNSNKMPEIYVLPGQLHIAVDKAERALIDSDVHIYQRHDRLIRPVRLPEGSEDENIIRGKGALIIKSVTAPWLKEKFSIVAHWVKKHGDEIMTINPPSICTTAYLSRVGDWNVPVLFGITQSPTLRSDGSILQELGYDPLSGILYDPGAVVFPNIPENPTKEDAVKALTILASPFREFCFVDGSAKSVALAAVITALVPRMFKAAPLFAFDAPTAGTGKSLLAETIGIIGTGQTPAMMSQGKSQEEDEKRLSSSLLAGDPIIVLDNCDRTLEGDFLCTMLTQEFVQMRILGKSEVTRLPTRCLVIATGNNLVLSGDVTRRAMICRLDAKKERPDLIQFNFDPREETKEKRAELVTAGLIILRAYIAEGRPLIGLNKIGSFEDWNIVREVLIWLGEKDPADTRERILADDPQKSELVDLLQLWWTALEDKRKTLAEIKIMGEQKNSVFMAELVTVLSAKSRSGTFNTRSIGRFLTQHVDRIVGGFVLHSKTDSSGTKLYWVINTEELKGKDLNVNKLPF